MSRAARKLWSFHCVALYLWLFGAVALNAADLTITLVPSDRLSDVKKGSLDPFRGNVLGMSGGTIFLYQEGDSIPRQETSASLPVSLDQVGMWLWEAEAPGWVTAVPGRINVTANSLDQSKEVIWPVVPACRVRLPESLDGKKVTRVDFVSLEEGSVHRAVSSHRRELNVPAGRFLYYSVRQGELLGIAGPRRCEQGETVDVEPPEPPPSHLQDFLVGLSLPESEQKIDLSAFEIDLQTSQGASKPLALIGGDQRASAFFRSVPAESASLRISHPELVTEQIQVLPAGGTARELPTVELALRGVLELHVDYRPLRPHSVAQLLLIRTASSNFDRGQNPTRGRRSLAGEPVEVLDLRSGAFRYTFSQLDDGKYRVDAVIDSDRLYALGFGVVPKFVEGRLIESSVRFETIDLREFELYGHLLLDDRLVPGALIFRPLQGELRRVFPTDDLEYHAYYFGRGTHRFDPAFSLPGDKSRPIQELLGLDRHYEVVACADSGACRSLKSAVIRGGGRLDIEIDAGPKVALEVTDASTGMPIEGAECEFEGYPERRLEFVNGKVDWNGERRKRIQVQVLRTNADGQAALHNPPDGLERVNVLKQGYRRFTRKLESLPGDGEVLEVELTPAGEDGVQFAIVVGRGVYLGGAMVAPLTTDTSLLDLLCVEVADTSGKVFLGRDCLEGRELMVFDPRAKIAAYPGSLVRDGGTLRVAAAPAKSTGLRVVDGLGVPIDGIPLSLVVDGVEIRNLDLIFAYQRTGWSWPFRTNENGEASLLGLGVDSAGMVQIGRGDNALTLDFSQLVPGRLLDVVLE